MCWRCTCELDELGYNVIDFDELAEPWEREVVEAMREQNEEPTPEQDTILCYIGMQIWLRRWGTA